MWIRRQRRKRRKRAVHRHELNCIYNKKVRNRIGRIEYLLDYPYQYKACIFFIV